MAGTRDWVGWAILVLVALCVAGAAIWVESYRYGQDDLLRGLEDLEEAELPSTESQPASAPASRPTTAAASRPAEPWTPPKFTARQAERDAMVRTIRRYGLDDKDVLAVMGAVPRHEFVPGRLSDSAYADRPLPIGYGQTISQPYMVAEMTRQLNLKSDSRVLEIGTGSGYQAAVLAHITPHVYTIEIVEQLARSADERLKQLGYKVVKVRHADGYHGWPGKVKFDAIVVTAAAGQIPPPLVKQLAPGGRMVIPIGAPFSTQSLVLVKKSVDGKLSAKRLMPVRFVPFVRKAE